MPRSRNDWDEELAAGMLEDLEKITGVSIGEMMADEIEELAGPRTQELMRADEEGSFEIFPVYEEPTEDEPFDLKNPDGMDTDNYFDELFDYIEVDGDSEDSYGDD